ncbi:hypothetical protein [Vibrio anguillarum]|uniref:Uncharacterized protein n=3 Tax=Vibrio anguillarum TaxID=55601 RepID=A0AAW4AYR6_VIBAN|nr:hypothetical protein [Vibrio anguillarum]AOT26263.1 hypothetical protein Her_0050 [Vibrio phage Her]AOT26354.1 hypothetical protein CLA_0050 [Vibrio phage Cla]AOT26536.1 hypothetical protein Pel_0050 [Vibrio phage Pel]AOT26627.1 hypothetical protein pVa2_0049 [Vibrio phage pVa-2]AOT26718.1 hypothetical protein pVa1_0050 [Vibrio phage pVa-1]AOT26809.1 hypothetical protein pVa5_0050 [Vibrio phage vB_VspP_pVa5_12Jun]AOT26900.1 hypothetical protein pVa6_0050 [Vibrio phage pVa-6]AOT26994.1 hy
MINEKNKQLAALVAQVGGVRKAAEQIKSVRGATPSKSAIDRAIKGGGTDYNVQCMIDDLLKTQTN